MTGTRKQELKLRGLSCADCSVRIEEDLAAVDGVAGASVNLADETVVLDLAPGGDLPRVLDEARRIVKRIDPGVIVSEKRLDKEARQIWLVLDLCCAECGGRIEQAVAEIPGVTGARLDFGRRELRLELAEERYAPRILRESQRRARRVVRGVRLRSDVLRARLFSRLKLAALAAGAPLFALGIASLVPALDLVWLSAAYILFGADVLLRAGRNIIRGKIFDENFLMTLATIGAFAVGYYAEAAAVMLFYKAGSLLEERAVERSRRSIKAALALRPDTARRLRPEGEELVRPEAAAVGDLIRVLPGERVPLDSTVMEGTSFVDESLLTGEAAPVAKAAGAPLFAGSVNGNGLLEARVEKAAADSTVAKILSFVESANRKKSKAEHFIGAFTRWYTPLVVAAALLLALVPSLLTGFRQWDTWLYRALIFLVISCPCALVLSVPLTFAAGIGRLARSGVLVKGGRYLEVLRRVATVVFDKTGTLTESSFRVTGVMPEPGFSADEVLRWAALAETYSAHPAAIAVRRAFAERFPEESGGGKADVAFYDEVAGLGVKALVDKVSVLVGSARLLEREGIKAAASAAGDAEVFVAVGGRLAGSILINEAVKANARSALEELRSLGMKRAVMLSGDREDRARAVGVPLGMDEIHAPLLPEEKVARFDAIKAATPPGGSVLCVGDGVNDAPLLARADVGAAMGALGRDAAIEAADLVVLDDDLGRLPLAVRLAKKTHRLVIQNVVLAFGVKALVLALGAFGMAAMWEAVFADVGVALLALLNALRIMRPLKTAR